VAVPAKDLEIALVEEQLLVSSWRDPVMGL
jgi:hypothetical protein